MIIENDDTDLLDIPRFIRGCIERAGGAVEDGPAGQLDALIPPDLEAVANGRTWVRLALGPAAVEDGVEMATPGTPFLDSLIAFASGRGTVGSGYLPAGRAIRKGLREEVERTLLFSNCRTRYDHGEADLLLAATAQFAFKVMFFSEERREKLYVVPVNLFSNQVQPLLAERLAELKIEPKPAAMIAEAPLVTVGAAYETACRALRQIVADEASRQQVRVAQRFAVELARINDYYGKLIAGLERRFPGDPASDKIQAVRDERERKLRELGETYGMRVRARLCSARCVWQPKTFFKLHIDRGATTRTLVLAYDGILQRLELPACDSCGRETARLWASPTARLLCPACAGQ